MVFMSGLLDPIFFSRKNGLLAIYGETIAVPHRDGEPKKKPERQWTRWRSETQKKRRNISFLVKARKKKWTLVRQQVG